MMAVVVTPRLIAATITAAIPAAIPATKVRISVSSSHDVKLLQGKVNIMSGDWVTTKETTDGELFIRHFARQKKRPGATNDDYVATNSHHQFFAVAESKHGFVHLISASCITGLVDVRGGEPFAPMTVQCIARHNFLILNFTITDRTVPCCVC